MNNEWPETLIVLVILLSVIGAIFLLFYLLKAIKKVPGTNYGERLINEIKYDLGVAKTAITVLFQVVFGLVILGVLAWFLYGVWAKSNEEWVCFKKGGGVVYTKGKPDSGWIEGKDGIFYPKETLEGCAKN